MSKKHRAQKLDYTIAVLKADLDMTCVERDRARNAILQIKASIELIREAAAVLVTSEDPGKNPSGSHFVMNRAKQILALCNAVLEEKSDER